MDCAGVSNERENSTMAVERQRTLHWLSASLTLAVAFVWLGGCASTKQPPTWAPLGTTVTGQGFLGDLYPQMQEGKNGQFLRVYATPAFRDPTAFARYKKILLDPVQLYAGPDSKLPSLPEEDQHKIAQALYSQLYEQLSKDYEMVTQPGPQTLRVSTAIVDAEKSDPALEAISYLPMPVGIPGIKAGVVQLKSTATGKPPFAGEVTVEGKLTDTQSNEVIGAMIDRRVGARHPIIGVFEKSTYDSWSDVDEAIRYGAERVRYILCQHRGASGCVEPKE